MQRMLNCKINIYVRKQIDIIVINMHLFLKEVNEANLNVIVLLMIYSKYICATIKSNKSDNCIKHNYNCNFNELHHHEYLDSALMLFRSQITFFYDSTGITLIGKSIVHHFRILKLEFEFFAVITMVGSEM